MIERTYRDKDRAKVEAKFLGDWTFGSELLEYVEQTYGDSHWYIDYCRQISPVQYVAKFLPFYGRSNGPLYIYISYHEDAEGGWAFSQRQPK